MALEHLALVALDLLAERVLAAHEEEEHDLTNETIQYAKSEEREATRLVRGDW